MPGELGQGPPQHGFSHDVLVVEALEHGRLGIQLLETDRRKGLRKPWPWCAARAPPVPESWYLAKFNACDRKH